MDLNFLLVLLRLNPRSLEYLQETLTLSLTALRQMRFIGGDSIEIPRQDPSEIGRSIPQKLRTNSAGYRSVRSFLELNTPLFSAEKKFLDGVILSLEG